MPEESSRHHSEPINLSDFSGTISGIVTLDSQQIKLSVHGSESGDNPFILKASDPSDPSPDQPFFTLKTISTTSKKAFEVEVNWTFQGIKILSGSLEVPIKTTPGS